MGIVTGYGLGERFSIPESVGGFFVCPLRPDRLWVPRSLLYSGYKGFFPLG
jgi:hypothetical protein